MKWKNFGILWRTGNKTMKVKSKGKSRLPLSFYLLAGGILVYYLFDFLIRFGLFDSAARVKCGKGKFKQKVKKEHRRRLRKGENTGRRK